MRQPAIQLHTLGGAFGMRSVSPFCLKLEMLLAHLQLDYTLVIEPDPRKAPKGKMPWARIDGDVYADSEIIIEKLNALTDGRVYAGLSAGQRALGLGMLRLAEEHLYWLMVAARWLDDDWWPNVVREMLSIIPSPVRGIVSALIRRRMRQTYRFQGLGLHSPSEQEAFARRDLLALQDAITKGGFLLGSEVSVFDFGIAAIMAGIYDNKPATRLTMIANEYDGLRRYTELVQETVGVYGRC